MPMNPNFLCCIGAELKNSTQQTTRMSQVYLYRSFEDDTLSDMLSAGFFNAAMGIIRKDDLLLLYSPNETTAKYTYARVSNVSSSGVVIEQIGIDATQIIVNTTGYSNLSGDNLQEIMNNLDTLLGTIQGSFVKLDGTSIMTGPLKFRAGSMQCAIAPYWDGVGFFKLNSNDSVTLLASMETTDGFCPAANNTYNIGKTNYKWKDLYVARVIARVLNNGANISVPTVGGTMALVEDINNKITNCITEIPQDIKLELNNGTLILKAGSKIYVPNGAGVFDVYTVASDISRTFSISSVKTLICLDIDNLTMPSNRIQDCTSGTTPPSGSGMFYDTSANTIRFYTSGTPSTHKISFPFAQLSFDSGGNCTIDQVFNGFGYIGSTIFALPGVKGLIPNGRNADGSLKNNTMTVQNVLTRTIPSNTGWHYFSISASGTSCDFRTNYFQGTSNPSSAPQFSVFYNYAENLSYLQATVGVWTQQNNFVCPFRIEQESSSPYKITSIKPASVFHAVDYNDTEFIANCVMPSNRYVDLTLPASGGTVTAPADGYITIAKATGAVNEYVSLTTNSNIQQNACCPITGFNIRLTIPVSKGDVISIGYTASGTTNAFRFIYANGSK